MTMEDHRRTGARAGPGTLTLLAGAGLVGAAAYAFAEARGRNRVAERPSDSAPRRTARIRDARSRAGQGRTVTIGRPRSEVWAAFRDFAGLAQVLETVVNARESGDRTLWTAIGPHGGEMQLETEIVEERAGHDLHWRAVPGTPVAMEGRVSFRDAPAGRGTEVTATVRYRPPGGRLAHAGAKAIGQDPRARVRRELKRLKMFLEAGEVATSANRRDA